MVVVVGTGCGTIMSRRGRISKMKINYRVSDNGIMPSVHYPTNTLIITITYFNDYYSYLRRLSLMKKRI